MWHVPLYNETPVVTSIIVLEHFSNKSWDFMHLCSAYAQTKTAISKGVLIRMVGSGENPHSLRGFLCAHLSFLGLFCSPAVTQVPYSGAGDFTDFLLETAARCGWKWGWWELESEVVKPKTMSRKMVNPSAECESPLHTPLWLIPHTSSPFWYEIIDHSCL